MKINNYLLTLLIPVILLIQRADAQVSINSNGVPPDASSMLDIASSTKGLLIPRVALTSTISNAPIGLGIATSLLVYNTTTSGAMSPYPVVPGFYYWNGTLWVYFSADKSWSLSGNAGTTPGINFMGTTDDKDVIIKRNNVQAGLLGYNTAWGVGALNSPAQQGFDNTAIGSNALSSNTTAYYNTANGSQALSSNTTGGYNTANGAYALHSNINGNSNTANGFNALTANISGTINTAIGSYALWANTTGNFNTAAGVSALQYNNGNSNNAFGYYALNANTSGTNNDAFGIQALRDNTTGSNNTATGNSALVSNQTGHDNTAVGNQALGSNSLGSYNTALGSNAGTNTALGSYNTALGSDAGTNNNNFDNTTALGNGATTLASNTVSIGNSSVTSIGGFQGWSNFSDGRFKRDVSESIPGLSFIKKLRPVTYHMDMDKIAFLLKTPAKNRLKDAEATKGAMMQTGFIAQEVEKAALESGFEFSGVDKPKNEGDFYRLRYAEFTVPLVKAVQEQQVLIEKLQLENKSQAKEIDDMKEVLKLVKANMVIAATAIKP